LYNIRQSSVNHLDTLFQVISSDSRCPRFSRKLKKPILARNDLSFSMEMAKKKKKKKNKKEKKILSQKKKKKNYKKKNFFFPKKKKKKKKKKKSLTVAIVSRHTLQLPVSFLALASFHNEKQAGLTPI